MQVLIGVLINILDQYIIAARVINLSTAVKKEISKLKFRLISVLLISVGMSFIMSLFFYVLANGWDGLLIYWPPKFLIGICVAYPSALTLVMLVEKMMHRFFFIKS